MPEHEPCDDPHLGNATGDDTRADWLFTLVLPSGQSVKGSITPEEFRDKIALVGVQVLEDHPAALIFSDGECFGSHAITFSVGADGRMD